MRKFALFLFLLFTLPILGQSTSVSVTVVDIGGQSWNNGTISYVFRRNPQFNLQPQWNNAPLPINYQTSTIVNLDNTGSATFSVPSNTAINPSGSSYEFTVCPNASIQCQIVIIPISGVTQNISSVVTPVLTPIVVSVQTVPFAYADNQVKTIPAQGGVYFDTTLKIPKFWNGSAFQAFGGNSSVQGTQYKIGAYGVGCSSSTTTALGCSNTTTDSSGNNLTTPGILNGKTVGGNTVGGSNTASQYSSLNAAITAAAANQRGVFNDLGTLGGFTNPSNVAIEWKNNLKLKNAGDVFPEMWGATGDGVTNDIDAIQSCLDYSSVNFVRCVGLPVSGTYYVASSVNNVNLVLKNNTRFSGFGPRNNTTIKSGINNPTFTIIPGPVQGVVMEQFYLECDATLPNSLGFYIEAQNGQGLNFGGLFESSFSWVNVNDCSKESLYLDAATATGTGTRVNQGLKFEHFLASASNTNHPEPIIKSTGQTGQILFDGGGANVNGVGVQYTNGLVNLQDSIDFTIRKFSLTMNGATQTDNPTTKGYVFTGGSSISVYDGDIEQVATPFFIHNVQGISVHDINFGNSGTAAGNTSSFYFDASSTVGQFYSLNYGFSSGFTSTGLATCQGPGNNLIFWGVKNNTGTLNCITQEISPASTVSLNSCQSLVFGDDGVTPIQTINSPCLAHQTMTLNAFGGHSFSIASGGNIDLGNYSSPLNVPAGGNLVLEFFDVASAIRVVSCTGCQPYRKEGAVITAASTITPVANTFHISGTTGITTITPLPGWTTTVSSGGFGGYLDFITDSAIVFSSGTGVGQIKIGFTSAAGVAYHCVYTPSTGLYYCK